MPIMTPTRSPSPANPQQARPSPLPSQLPACYVRKSDTITRAQSTLPSPPSLHPAHHRPQSLLTMLLRSPITDLYANRAQHQFFYYLTIHMLLFYAVFRAQHSDPCFSTRPWNAGLVFAWYDEILPFCLYTGLALCHYRDWRTVSKWEYIAMLVSWTKSVIVLHASYKAVSEGKSSGVGFPDNKVDYAVFGVVRFLVFGGLYKMVQAGLNKTWERSWKEPARVVAFHRPVPVRLQRMVGNGVRRRRRVSDPLDTVERRRRYWEEHTNVDVPTRIIKPPGSREIE